MNRAPICWFGAQFVISIVAVCTTVAPSAASSIGVVAGRATSTGPLIVGNNSAFGGGPIQTYDFSTGALVHSFVPDGASNGNGRGVAVAGNEIFYTELGDSAFGPSDSIHVAPFNGGTGGVDIRTLPNPAPSAGIQDLDYLNGVLYALTGNPASSLQVWKLDPATGDVLAGPIAINSSSEADGFTVLPNGNFLINSAGLSCSYVEYDSTTGAPTGVSLTVPGATECTGVATNGSVLYFQTGFDGFTETNLSGKVIGQVTVTTNLVQDISLVGVSSPQARTLVAIGDSYSSGEANPPFDPGTNTLEDKCHRSVGAWPRLLAVSDPTITMEAHIACSGAKAIDVRSQSFNNELPQIAQLATLPHPPRLITITIGASDVGLSSLIRNCFVADCSLDHRLGAAKVYIQKTLPGILSRTYRAIRRAEPNSTVVVVGYPRLFPLTQAATHKCGWLTATERTKLNDIADLLNSVIATAAKRPGFTYVSTLNAFDGHEECQAHSWLYAIGRRPLPYDTLPIAQGQKAVEAVVRKALS